MSGAEQHTLEVYGLISVKSGEMLEAAKSSDWDRLVALEGDCRDLIETLKRSNADVGTETRFLQRKIGLIRKVLADDAEIRKLTEPWMTQLEAYLGRARQEQKLRRAYEPDDHRPG